MTNTATTAVPAAHDHAPAGEHEVRETITLDFYYPDHPPRTESAVFRATVTAGKAKGETCAVCGVDDPEYHHFFIEWADANAVRWSLVKAVAMGEMASPTAALTWIIELARVRGFGWAAFDPTKPEQFVDSPQNMVPLCPKHHRLKGHGIHQTPFPIWIIQAWPKVDGFVFAPDETPK